MKKEVKGLEVVVVETKQLGRKVDPTSARQQRIAELEAKKASGELRKGRPVVSDSARQLRLKELEAKRANGDCKRGRPVETDSARQKRLAEIEAKRAAGLLQKGRPVSTESKRQQRIAELEAKAQANGGVIPKGRPKQVKVEEVIEVVVEETVVAKAKSKKK